MSKTKTVVLRKLTLTDLCATYARDMGGNKIRHYNISVAKIITDLSKFDNELFSVAIANVALGKTTGESYADMLADESVEHRIKSEEGEDTNVVILPRVPISTEMVDATDAILSETKIGRNIKSALLKNTPKSFILLLDRKLPLPIAQRVKNTLYSLVNPLVSVVNNFSLRLYRFFNPSEDTSKNPPNFRLNTLPVEPDTVQEAHLAHFLSVAFEQGREEEAVQALLDDLTVLHNLGLILGSVNMPTMTMLEDTKGTGKLNFALFCNPFLDYPKLIKSLELKTPDFGRASYFLEAMRTKLGLKTVSFEGQVGQLDLRGNYEIEEVKGKSVSAFDLHVEDYLASVPLINKIAKRQSTDLKNKELMQKHFGDYKVAVASSYLNNRSNETKSSDVENILSVMGEQLQKLINKVPSDDPAYQVLIYSINRLRASLVAKSE